MEISPDEWCLCEWPDCKKVATKLSTYFITYQWTRLCIDHTKHVESMNKIYEENKLAYDVKMKEEREFQKYLTSRLVAPK